MMADTAQVPDLATVLRTLSQFVPGAANGSVGLNSVQTDDELEEGEYVPQDVAAASAPPQNLRTTRSSTIVGTDVHLGIARPAPRKGDGATGVDPATLTDWPSGLRCVMRTVARDDTAIARIKKMIHVQHEHERQWWEERQVLLRKHAARVDGRRKLDDVLRAVGGAVDPASAVTVRYLRHLGQTTLHAAKSTQDVDDDATELKTYDLKVHKAATEMTRAMTAELRQLGVPFFPAAQSNPNGAAGIRDGLRETAGARPSDEQKMKELQRRVLGLLEDMCRE